MGILRTHLKEGAFCVYLMRTRYFSFFFCLSYFFVHPLLTLLWIFLCTAHNSKLWRFYNLICCPQIARKLTCIRLCVSIHSLFLIFYFVFFSTLVVFLQSLKYKCVGAWLTTRSNIFFWSGWNQQTILSALVEIESKWLSLENFF